MCVCEWTGSPTDTVLETVSSNISGRSSAGVHMQSCTVSLRMPAVFHSQKPSIIWSHFKVPAVFQNKSNNLTDKLGHSFQHQMISSENLRLIIRNKNDTVSESVGANIMNHLTPFPEQCPTVKRELEK